MTNDDDKEKRGRRGEGTVYWDATKNCYRGEVTLGQKPNGDRIRARRYGKTVNDVQRKLRKARSDHDKGVKASAHYKVADALKDWLARGRKNRSEATKIRDRILVNNRLIPGLGAVPLHDLRVDHVDDWLESMAPELATSSLRLCRSILRRAVALAQARGKIDHNVVALVTELPVGRSGRPSKSLTFDQAKAIIDASKEHGWIHAYLVLSLLTGVRTEEARALRWEHVHLFPAQEGPAHVEVWRSTRPGGDTKTKLSRRTIALPPQVVEVLANWQGDQEEARRRNGHKHQGITYVFGTRYDTEINPNNVERSLYRILEYAGLPPAWTPRELRHTFVSMMSAAGAPDELIADIVGHVDTSTLRRVYRHQLKPVITEGAHIMSDYLEKQGFLDT